MLFIDIFVLGALILVKLGLINQALASFVAGAMIYLLPVYLAYNCWYFAKNKRFIYWLMLSLISEFIVFAIICALSFLSVDRSLFITDATYYSFVLTNLIFIVMGALEKKQKNSIVVNKKDLYELLLLTTVATGLFFIVYRVSTPIPGIVNWDLLHHLNMVRELIKGNFSLILSQISDTFTFNSYTPFFHILIVAPTLLFKADTTQVMWWAEFFHYLFTTYISYWLGKKVLGGRWGALMTALISLFIFESTVAYTNLFFLPLTLAGTLGALFTAEIITSHKKEFNFKNFVLGFLIVFMIHYMIGIAYLLLISVIYIYHKSKSTKLKKILLIGSFVFLTASVLINYFNQKLFITDRPDAKHFIYSIQELLAMFNQWYGFLPILFIPAGLYFIIKKKHELGWMIVFAVFSLSGMAFFPFSYGLKVYALDRYFINLLIVCGILSFLHEFHNRFLQIFLIIVVSLAFCSVFVANINAHLQLSYNGKNNSYISKADLEAANWLNNNFKGKRIYLISDPTTQAVFEALAGINSQGGAFPRPDTVELISSINSGLDATSIRDILLKVHDTLPYQNGRDITLFVLSGRYFNWQRFSWECKTSYACQSWLPQEIQSSDYDLIQKMTDSNYFKAIFKNKENVIFELK